MKYNQLGYNEQRYDINGVFYATSLSETVTEVDGTQLADLLKALNDSLAPIDATVLFAMSQNLFDFLFLDEMIQIQFANKALSDTVRLADWLSIERNPSNNEWFD